MTTKQYTTFGPKLLLGSPVQTDITDTCCLS